jgi:Ni,Fe-hydrogenase I large subunit
MSKKIQISPFNRVEGDLEIVVEVKDGIVQNAMSKGVMFRGFEMMLKGRDPMDAIVFTPRICGICGASHGLASATTLRNAWKCQMPDNAYLVGNIVLAIENLMGHMIQFYVLFAPDLTNKKYATHQDYSEIVKRFYPFKGTSYLKAIQARPSMLEIMGVFAGKWPNTLVFQPGGVTNSISMSRQTKAIGLLREIQDYLEQSLIGCKIDRWLDNKSLNDLEQWLGEADHYKSDMGTYVRYSRDIGLDKIGKGFGKFISHGAYEQPGNGTLFASGYYDNGVHPFEQEKILEYIKYSFLTGYSGGLHPSEGITEPDPNKEGAYSWCKSPRYDNNVVETGPLARMILDKDPLICDIFEKLGSSVFLRVLARLHEAVRLVRQLGIWLLEIDPREPFYKKPKAPPETKGVGIIEAARGALGHWVSITDNRIERYQIITPTAWNLSPKDSFDQHGPCEHALNGTRIEDEDNPVEVGHVVRSFDPCLVCTVHTIKL